MIKTSPLLMRLFTTGVIVFVTGVAISGLILSGSPAAERMRRLDTQRVSDLQQISYAMDSFWSTQQRLPENLDQLQATRDVYVQSIHDPKTKALYEYSAKGNDAYELCATFETSSTEPLPGVATPVAVPLPPDGSGRFWTHPVGHTCFPLSIRKPTPPSPVK